MLSSSSNQYLRPEYLQPLPTTLDAKNSPLALLAQTCSSIGKDIGPSKPIIPPMEKPKMSDKKSHSPSSFNPSSSSKTDKAKEEQVRSPPVRRKTPSPKQPAEQHREKQRETAREPERESRRSPASSSAGCRPEPQKMSPPMAAPMPPPRLSMGLTGNMFLDLDMAKYAHMYDPSKFLSKSAVLPTSPYCRDPFCAQCLSLHHAAQAHMLSHPSGCTQCLDPSKLPFLSSGMPLMPTPTLPPTSASLFYPPLGMPSAVPTLPLICNWVTSEGYCGKRFAGSDELLQHLRSHASENLTVRSSFQPKYPTSVSPRSSSTRFHPYSKPGVSAFSSSSTGSTSPPVGLSPFSAYYNLYGPRLGAV